jgi:chromosome partitioning protein
MRKLAILNQKGGVGKTTTAVNLSAALARQGQRVCVMDLDPQAHASLHLSSLLEPPAQPGRTMYHVFTETTPLAGVRQAAGQNLWVCAADIELAAVEVELAGIPGRELVLRTKIEADNAGLDFLVIDCPPSLGVLTLNALCAVDEVYIPLQPHFLALHGLGKLLETIELVALRLNPPLRLGGVIVCMYESSTKLAAEVVKDAENFLNQSRGHGRPWSDARVFASKIRRNVRLAEAPSFGKSILDYAPDSPGAADYAALAEEFLRTAVPQVLPMSSGEFQRTMGTLSQPIVLKAG